MTRVILLDTGLLGLLAHPRADPEVRAWLERHLDRGRAVRVPEIADYEVRRELLRIGSAKSLHRLDALARATGYVPITTAAMRKAAEFWADARKRGRPTADAKALDGDVILAAQAATLPEALERVVVATTDVGHLSLFVDARQWQQIA